MEVLQKLSVKRFSATSCNRLGTPGETMSAPGHVGIVIAGHDMMIDAPQTGQTVTRQSFAGSADLVGFTSP